MWFGKKNNNILQSSLTGGDKRETVFSYPGVVEIDVRRPEMVDEESINVYGCAGEVEPDSGNQTSAVL